MHHRPKILLLAAVLAVLILTGCKVGPDYHGTVLPYKINDSYQYHPVEGGGPVQEDCWWEMFGDEELNRLVAEALQYNLDLARAAARILELRAGLVQARADKYPTASLQGQWDRSSITTKTPAGFVNTKLQPYTLALPVSFELDLWGKVARLEEAAVADLFQAEENRWTLAQSVVAETVLLYLEMESYERRIQITQATIDNYRFYLELIQLRYEQGLVSILTLRQARRNLAQAEASLPSLIQSLGQTQQKIAVLMGKYPKTTPPRKQPEDYYKRLTPVPPGLPSDILARRPDIRAAEAALRAACARIGAAKALRLPSIQLTGSFGYKNEELDVLFRPYSELWSIAAGITQPIFNAGKLKANQRAFEARYRQTSVDYAKTVLEALSEVEGALLAREQQLKRRERTLEYLKEARAAQQAAEERFERGLVEYLNVLEAQQARFRAEESLIQVDLAIFSNRVSLHRALGGGWAMPSPVCEPENIFSPFGR